MIVVTAKLPTTLPRSFDEAVSEVYTGATARRTPTVQPTKNRDVSKSAPETKLWQIATIRARVASMGQIDITTSQHHDNELDRKLVAEISPVQ